MSEKDVDRRLELADQISRAVTTSGLPKSTASLRLGMSNTVVGKIMAGKVESFSLTTLERMAARLDDLGRTNPMERMLRAKHPAPTQPKGKQRSPAPRVAAPLRLSMTPAPQPACPMLVRAALTTIAAGTLSAADAAEMARQALTLLEV